VLQGETRIGMTLHRMVRRADAGPIVDQEGVDIGPRDTAEQAFRRALPLARRILGRQIDALLAGTAREIPQDDAQATYFTGRKPEDGRIRWTQSSLQIFNLIRAVTDPYPGAFTEVDGARLMIWWAEIDSPAFRALARQSPPGQPGAGEILTITPLIVATGDGAIELTRIEWRRAKGLELRAGMRFQ
jgi:methionyl-tRNA formyltransferase